MKRPGPIAACFYPFYGLAAVLRRRELRLLGAMPALTGMAIWGGLAWGAVLLYPWARDALTPEFMQSPSWIAAAGRLAVGVLVAVALLAAWVISFLLLGSLAAAPYLGPLAARAASCLRGQDLPGEELPLLKGAVAALSWELRKLLISACAALALGLLSLVPLAGWAAGLASPLLTAFLAAVEFLDFPLQRGEPSFKRTLTEWSRNPLAYLAFGAVVAAVMPVPVLGFLMLPGAAVGATLLYMDSTSGRAGA